MIVVDGSNGAGKSTIINEIDKHLKSLNQEAIITREPGGTPIGENIRELLLSNDAQEMTDVTELMLFAAARAQHVREKILPAIEAGKIIISDRFDSATISFQHYARGLSLDLITLLNDVAVDGLTPDKTIILDLDPVVGLERVGSRGSELDRMEKEELDFLHKARDGYLAQAQASPDNFVVIDASQPLQKVIDDVIHIINELVDK